MEIKGGGREGGREGRRGEGPMLREEDERRERSQENT